MGSYFVGSHGFSISTIADKRTTGILVLKSDSAIEN
jgi:hypothetical protein